MRLVLESPVFPGLGSQVLVWVTWAEERGPGWRRYSPSPMLGLVQWDLAAGIDLGFSQAFITGARAGTFFKWDL